MKQISTFPNSEIPITLESYSLNYETNIYNEVDADDYFAKFVDFVRNKFIKYEIPIMHLRPVDIPNREYLTALIHIRDSTKNIYSSMNTTDAKQKLISSMVKNRYMKLEALRYRMTIYQLRLNRLFNFVLLTNRRHENIISKIIQLRTVVSIIDVAVHLLDKSIMPYNADFNFRRNCLDDEVDFGGDPSDLLDNDDTKAVPPGMYQNINELNHILNLIKSEERKYRLEQFHGAYTTQFAELIRRAKLSDFQLQHRLRRAVGWGTEEYERRTATSALLQNLKALRPNVIGDIKEEYLRILRQQAITLQNKHRERDVDNFIHGLLKQDRDAMEAEINAVENLDLSTIYDPQYGNENAEIARKWILNEYINYMNNIFMSSKKVLEESIEHNKYQMENLNKYKTDSPIIETKGYYFPFEYTRLLESYRTSTPGTPSNISVSGLHMRTFDIIPMPYLILNSDSFNLLEHIRELDKFLDNKPNKTYMILTLFILGIRKILETGASLKQTETFNAVFNAVINTWMNNGINAVFEVLNLHKDFLAFYTSQDVNNPDPIKANLAIHTEEIRTVLLRVFREIYLRGDSVYYNIIAIAKDRMYDQTNNINEFHLESFHMIHNAINCLFHYTNSNNAAFSLARCFLRLQFIKYEKDSKLEIAESIWNALLLIFNHNWGKDDSKKLEERHGTAVMHVLSEIADLMGDVNTGRQLQTVVPFFKCYRQLQHVPYEVANVLLDFMYIGQQTHIQADRTFEVFSHFRDIDDKLAKCEMARNVWETVWNDINIHSDSEPINIAQADCPLMNPQIQRDIQDVSRKIAALTTKRDQDLLKKHIPSRYELVYTDYRYAYLPRELKNILDDAYYYFNLNSEKSERIMHHLDMIVTEARRPNSVREDTNKSIYQHLANRYAKCVHYVEGVSEQKSENPLIMLYDVIIHIFQTFEVATSRRYAFEMYVDKMEALFKRIKDPNKVAGQRSNTIAMFERFFLPSEKADALIAVRKLVSLSRLTEYPEINVYNQRHVLHYAWRAILQLVSNISSTVTRDIIKSVIPHLGTTEDVILNTFVETVKTLYRCINGENVKDWNICDNVILMLYDHCELKTMYTRTPTKAMVYPAEFKNLLIEFENSLDIHKCASIYTRYFAGVLRVCEGLDKIMPTPHLSNPQKVQLAIQKYDRQFNWKTSFLHNLRVFLTNKPVHTVYNVLTSIGINHLVFLPSAFSLRDANLYLLTNFINESVFSRPPELLDYLDPRKIEDYDLKLKMAATVFAAYNDHVKLNTCKNETNEVLQKMMFEFVKNPKVIELGDELLKIQSLETRIRYLHYIHSIISIELSSALTNMLRLEFLNRQDWLMRYINAVLNFASQNNYQTINNNVVNAFIRYQSESSRAGTKINESIDALNYELMHDTLRLFRVRIMTIRGLKKVIENWKSLLDELSIRHDIENNTNYTYISKRHSFFHTRGISLFMGDYEISNRTGGMVRAMDTKNTYIEFDPTDLFDNSPTCKRKLFEKESYNKLLIALHGAEEAIDYMRIYGDSSDSYDNVDEMIADEFEKYNFRLYNPERLEKLLENEILLDQNVFVKFKQIANGLQPSRANTNMINTAVLELWHYHHPKQEDLRTHQLINYDIAIKTVTDVYPTFYANNGYYAFVQNTIDGAREIEFTIDMSKVHHLPEAPAAKPSSFPKVDTLLNSEPTRQLIDKGNEDEPFVKFKPHRYVFPSTGQLPKVEETFQIGEKVPPGTYYLRYPTEETVWHGMEYYSQLRNNLISEMRGLQQNDPNYVSTNQYFEWVNNIFPFFVV
uniref:Uncharacterized protein n=1 Tax=Ixodes ricinus TaxID=34613 RepID=A0A0K8RJB0_IXORI